MTYEDDPEVLAARLGGEPGFVYARCGNPTVRLAEEAIAELEGGDDAIWCASGMAALTLAALSMCTAGETVLCADRMYGGTGAMLDNVIARMGVRVTYAPHDAFPETANPSLVLIESIANPALDVPDLPRIAARFPGVVVVDNTFATPLLCRPLDHKVALSLHSATKYLGGHGDLTGGVVVGRQPLIDRLRSVAISTGLVGDPWNAWLCLRGLTTLAIRMERQCDNARVVAEWLRQQGHKVRTARPTAWLSDSGGMVVVDVGSHERALEVLRGLRLFRNATSLGDAHSLAVHPATTSHRHLSGKGLQRAGVTPGMLRLSVGIEDADDLVDDLRQAGL